MKKLFYFGLFKKFLLILFLFLSTSKADGTYSGIYFTTYEENATVYLCNYYSYGYLKDIVNNSTTANNIVNGRVDSLYTSVSDIDAISGVSKNRLHRLKQASHLIDWNKYSDDFGMTLHETNFIYALVAVLIGFVFLFFSVYVLVLKV